MPAAPRFDLESPLVSDPTGLPEEFRRAVAALSAVRPRPELVLSPLDAPPRLAPYTWAVSVEADADRRPGEDLDEPDTSGRLILLHDPAGQDAWEGRFRLVCFVQARLDPEQVGDEMLPTVGWSWLTEALEQNGAAHVALGGTVTQTSSVRFGDIAGPRRTDDVELRASWTPAGPPNRTGTCAGTPRRSARWCRPPPACPPSGSPSLPVSGHDRVISPGASRPVRRATT